MMIVVVVTSNFSCGGCGMVNAATPVGVNVEKQVMSK